MNLAFALIHGAVGAVYMPAAEEIDAERAAAPAKPMTLQQMQRAKAQAERSIRRTLDAFMRTTRSTVREVRLELIDVRSISRPSEYIAGDVRLDVRL